MFSRDEVIDILSELDLTHVVSLPDSTLGRWEEAVEAMPDVRLVRVCREGEAWAVAAGLHLGGARPLVMIQCTGLFESGDSLRNVLHDYQLPLFALVGYRSYLGESTLPGDTARVYTEPVLKAWGLDFRLLDRPDRRGVVKEHYEACRGAGRPGVVLIAEGRA